MTNQTFSFKKTTHDGLSVDYTVGAVRLSDGTDIDAADPIAQYTKEALDHNVMTPATERRALRLLVLAKGHAASCTDEVERVLAEAYVERIKHFIVRNNLRLVIPIAKSYYYQSGRSMHWLELAQEGNVGLMRGVDTYDLTKKTKLSTHVTYWIRQAITRALHEKSKSIRMPVHMGERINTVRKLVRLFEADNEGRSPEPDELAYEYARRRFMLDNGREPKTGEISPKMIDRALVETRDALDFARQSDLLSLDKTIGDKSEGDAQYTLMDAIPGNDRDDLEQAIDNGLLRDYLELVVFPKLSPRIERVLRMRFGLYYPDDTTPMNLREIGLKFGLTRERIRQLEGLGLRKIHKMYGRQLAEWVRV